MGQVRVTQAYLFNALAVTGTNTYTSAIIPIDQKQLLGFQITFTSTAVGTLLIQASDDGVNFVTLADNLFTPTLTQPAGSGLAILTQYTLQCPYLYLQASYTNATGSGAMTVIMSGKDLD